MPPLLDSFSNSWTWKMRKAAIHCTTMQCRISRQCSLPASLSAYLPTRP